MAINQDLITKTIEIKNFNFIVRLLENYNFSKAKQIPQSELNSFLQYIDLTKNEKCRLAEDSKNILENSNKNCPALLASCNQLILSMILNIEY